MTLEAFYNTFPYPSARNYVFDKSKNEIITATIGPRNVAGKLIYSFGCGTSEAVILANNNPDSLVIGMDLSKTAIQIAKSIRRKYKIRNCNLQVADFTETEIEAQADFIICTGVLHHLPDIHKALKKVQDLLDEHGMFLGMVYSDRMPEFIPRLNKYFIENSYTPSDVAQYLFNHDEEEKAIAWFLTHALSEQEVADTWLHPSFTGYSRKKLLSILQEYFPRCQADYSQSGYNLYFRASKK